MLFTFSRIAPYPIAKGGVYMETSPLPFKIEGSSKTIKYKGDAVLTLSIRRPVFSDTGKMRRIEQYFSEVGNQWLHRWETVLFPAACQAKDLTAETERIFLPWQTNMDFTVTLWKPPLLSLRIDVTERRETNHPLLFCTGETWDCTTGYPRTLRSFFPAGNHRWRKELLLNLREQVSARLSSGESLLDPDCSQLLARTFDPNRFYLTEEGIAIFYPLYTLGAYAEGIPVFHIPLSKS